MKNNVNLKEFNTFGIEVFAKEFEELNSTNDAISFFQTIELKL